MNKLSIIYVLIMLTIVIQHGFAQDITFSVEQILNENEFYYTNDTYSFQLDNSNYSHIIYTHKQDINDTMKLYYNNNITGTFDNQTLIDEANDSTSIGMQNIFIDSSNNVHISYVKNTNVYNDNWDITFHNSEIFYANNINQDFFEPINILDSSVSDLFVENLYLSIDQSSSAHILFSAKEQSIQDHRMLYYTKGISDSFLPIMLVADSLISWNFAFEVDNELVHIFSVYDPENYIYGWNVGYWFGNYSTGFSNVQILDSNADNNAWSSQIVQISSALDKNGAIHLIYRKGNVWYSNNISGNFINPEEIIELSQTWGSGGGAFSLNIGFSGIHIGYFDDLDSDLTNEFWDYHFMYSNNLNNNVFENFSIFPRPESCSVKFPNMKLDNEGILHGIINCQSLYYFTSDQIVDSLQFYPDTLPQTPQNLTAIPGNQRVTVTWSPNTESDINKYNIYRFSMPPTALIDSVFHPDTTYIDTGLTNSLTYHYHITAVDSAGNESGASNTISATPTDGPIPYNNFLWSARFGGRVGNVVDLNNYIGVIDGATNSEQTPDIYDEPEPPHAPSNYLSLYFGQTGQIGGRASVLAYPVDWGNNNPIHLTIDTDLNRDQTFTLELELASTSLYGVNVFTYKYHNGMDVDYQLVWGQDSTTVTVEFLEIPNYIYLFFDDLLGYEVSFTTPPTDSTIYRLGGENLSIAFTVYISTYHLFYYSYVGESWVYVGDHVPWENTPLDDHGYFRVINTHEAMSSAKSGDVVFFSNHTSLNANWNFFSIPHSGGDGFINDMIWHPSTPNNYYLYTYINGVGWSTTDQIDHNKGYALHAGNYSVGYIDTSYDNMDLSIDIGAGWNLIGSPFKFDKDLHDARIIQMSNPTDTVPFDLAVTNNWLIGTIYDYADNSNYVTTDVLWPWKSYWLAGLVDSLEFIYPSTERVVTRSREDIWSLRLTFVTGYDWASRISLGASTDATDNFDAGYDYPKPPPFPENGYLNTYFYHDDWTDQFSGRFMSDIRSGATVQEWIIDAVNDTMPTVTISWSPDQIPSDVNLYLNTGSEIFNLKDHQSIALNTTDLFPLVVFTTIEELKITGVGGLPSEFALHNNYPNPFNPITLIRYDVPDNSHASLIIYDILGREVVELVNRTVPAGYYSILWNGRNSIGDPVSAGIYFYRLTTNNFIQTKKMILLK